MSKLDTEFFFLSPVQVVLVTKDNLQDVAEWCGGKVAETESRRVEGRMDSYVWVPTPTGSNISWAFPGMYVTRRVVLTIKGEFKETWAVFRKNYFVKNYFETPTAAVDATWEKFLRQPDPANLKITREDKTDGQHLLLEGEPKQVTVNVYVDSQAELDRAQKVVEQVMGPVTIVEESNLGKTDSYVEQLMTTPQEI